MSVIPRAYPEEFRRDVVELARRNETPIAHIAKNFGISDAVTRFMPSILARSTISAA